MELVKSSAIIFNLGSTEKPLILLESGIKVYFYQIKSKQLCPEPQKSVHQNCLTRVFRS